MCHPFLFVRGPPSPTAKAKKNVIFFHGMDPKDENDVRKNLP